MRLSRRTPNACAPQPSLRVEHPARPRPGAGGRALSTAAAAALLAATGAAAAACGDDGVRPAESLSGTYRLISVGGSAPPYIYWCSARGGCEQINAGRIEIMSRGRLRDIGEFQSVGAPATTSDVDTLVAAYELSDSRLIIKRTFAGGSPIEYDDTAAVLNGVLQITLKPRMVNGRPANGGVFFYTKE